eukprot:TRINITY_DN51176_c0_g1_i1.p1 TRINITY_DN51176_c0_g1~~TRINITY_DN51176_c0_g1_i1.p1  ORF type:complete len:712 (+),score=146.91 TRINITY_DN51176_c0_g1_i1:85-2220(+)
MAPWNVAAAGRGNGVAKAANPSSKVNRVAPPWQSGAAAAPTTGKPGAGGRAKSAPPAPTVRQPKPPASKPPEALVNAGKAAPAISRSLKSSASEKILRSVPKSPPVPTKQSNGVAAPAARSLAKEKRTAAATADDPASVAPSRATKLAKAAPPSKAAVQTNSASRSPWRAARENEWDTYWAEHTEELVEGQDKSWKGAALDPLEYDGGLEAEEEEDLAGDVAAEDVPMEDDGSADVSQSADAVKGNMQLKRALSDNGLGDWRAGAWRAKRRRTDESAEESSQRQGLVQTLLRNWRQDSNRGVQYALQQASIEELNQLLRTQFWPRDGHSRTHSEQVYEQILRQREKQLPWGGQVSQGASLGHRFGMEPREVEAVLKPLNHSQFRRLMHFFDAGLADGSETLPEIIERVEELEAPPPEMDGAANSAGTHPGYSAVGRASRLELMDPEGDALVLGDANLTFALELAAHRNALQHTGRTIATTFEKLETLKERYGEIEETVAKLEELGVEVLHDVDCTRLVHYEYLKDMKFTNVYYNFPHAGVIKGFFDGHPFVRWRHANLMHLFFRALHSFMAPNGIVKVSSNQNAQGVRYSDIILGASASEFAHIETFPLTEWQLKDYYRSYGDRRDANRRPGEKENYRAQNNAKDMVYCFRFLPIEEAELPAPNVVYPPSKLDLFLSDDGRLPPRGTSERKRVVEEMYTLFMSYVDGIHVG